jgi:hypothetical protein
MNFKALGISLPSGKVPQKMILKLTIILLIPGCLQVRAIKCRQKTNVSEKDIPMEKMFTMVRNQTGYVFFYNYAIFQGARTVSLDIKQRSVIDVLNAYLKMPNGRLPKFFFVFYISIGLKRKSRR